MLETTIAQPAPGQGREDVTRLVIADLEARALGGEMKYGTRLQTFNGRDAEIDLYQELMDALLYLRQRIAERQEREAGFVQEFDGQGIS